MARFGFVVLALWEAFVIFSIVFLMVLDNPSVDVWDLSKVLLICCIVIPAAVRILWRTTSPILTGDWGTRDLPRYWPVQGRLV